MDDTTQGKSGFARLSPIPETGNKYEILGVNPQATDDELKVAYRRLALLYHPDRHTESDRAAAEQAFKCITSAYRTLSDESQRRSYDQALNRGEDFHEPKADDSGVALSAILAGIDRYEHIFSSEKLGEIDSTIKNIVKENLIGQLGEHVVGVWPMKSAPEGSAIKGSFKAGAVVLTNLRVLLPFTFQWEEQRGNTKYRYNGAGMPAIVLPLVEEIGLVSEKRLRKTVWVEIKHSEGTARFRPGLINLSKLLLIAKLWGIPVEGREVNQRSEELRWAIVSPWRWALGLAVTAVVLAAISGFFWGGFFDNPIYLVTFFIARGLWQWAVIGFAALSGMRLWRWMLAHKSVGLGTGFENKNSNATSASLPKRVVSV